MNRAQTLSPRNDPNNPAEDEKTGEQESEMQKLIKTQKHNII